MVSFYNPRHFRFGRIDPGLAHKIKSARDDMDRKILIAGANAQTGDPIEQTQIIINELEKRNKMK